MRRNGAAMPVLICNASDFCKIAAAKRFHVAKDLPGVPIPPFEVKQVRDQLIVKPPPDHAARIPARDAVWRNILCDDGIRADDRAVANVYARHHGHILADPDVAADYGVAFQRKVVERRRERFLSAAHDIERIGRDAVHPVVRAVHHKFDPPCDGAEFPDDEPVTQKFVMVRHVLLKSLRAVHIVIVAVLSNNDVGARDDAFDVYDLLDVLIRMDLVRVRAGRMLRTSMNFGSLSASIVPYRDVDGKDISKGQKRCRNSETM